MNEVYIPWVKVKDKDPNWNEICATVVEKFGLPGDRYQSHPSDDWMVFDFFDEQDALMCKLLLSEYIVERNSWILTIDQNGMIEFPADLLRKTGWKEGDSLEWQNNGNRSFTLKKKV